VSSELEERIVRAATAGDEAAFNTAALSRTSTSLRSP
jgi:hypothetical protein